MQLHQAHTLARARVRTQGYEDMPIEEFGKAMLRGMGWTEGMGVGRNRKEAQPIEYLRR